MRLEPHKKLGSLVAALLFATILIGTSASARAETAAGPRFGYNFDYDRVLIGGEVRFDITKVGRNAFMLGRPSLDVFVGNHSDVAFAFDLLFAFLTPSRIEPYFGPGVGVVSRPGGADFGMNLAGGVLFNARRTVQPFVESRVTVSSHSFVCILGGIAFQL